MNDRLVIVRKTGAATRALNLGSWRARFAIATTGCTFGHNAGANTISMAAVNVGTAGGGAFTGGAGNPVETYSCDGLRRIFYNPAGTAITPGNLLFGTNGGTLLQKPDWRPPIARPPARLDSAIRSAGRRPRLPMPPRLRRS